MSLVLVLFLLIVFLWRVVIKGMWCNENIMNNNYMNNNFGLVWKILMYLEIERVCRVLGKL